ncbi:MAG: hypothetical protein IPI05_05295 [Flavobacteriales bacterium]|nr:hypothetical protein [Flavobacteriales bacterium]
MASETLNRFWVVDGNLGDIVMYDFEQPHEPGGSDHSDSGGIHRFNAFTITKDPNNVVSHRVPTKHHRLYVVDFGGQGAALDIHSGTVGCPSLWTARTLCGVRDHHRGYWSR